MANNVLRSCRANPHNHKHGGLFAVRQVQPSVESGIDRDVLEWNSEEYCGGDV